MVSDDFHIEYGTNKKIISVKCTDILWYSNAELYRYIKDTYSREEIMRIRKNNLNDLLDVDEISEEETIPFKFPTNVIINLNTDPIE